jgi:hypothetical protein
MGRVQIKTIAPEIIDGKDDLRITAPLPDATILIDGDFISTHILRKYSYWSFDSDLLTASTEFSEFLNYFQTYARVRQEDFYRLWQAMRADYNPIENYNQIEVTETENHQHRHEDRDIDSKYNQTETVSTTHAQTQTVTTRINQVQTVHTKQDRDYNYDEIQHPKKTVTENPGTTMTHAATSYDSAEPTTTSTDTAGGETTNTEEYDGNDFLYQNRENDVITSYGFPEGSTAEGDTVKTAYTGDPDKVETTHSGQPDHTDDNTETYYTGEADKVTLTRKGNIGVTTSQQMIDSEIALRLRGIVEEYIDIIIESFCYLALTYESGGDEEIEYYFI